MNTVKVTNIAELKQRKGTVDTTVEVLGYYTSGDGGGGSFYWDNTSVENNNDGTIIQVSTVSTGRWKRIINNEYYDARAFGATTSNVDNTSIIQVACNYIGSINSGNTGGTLYIPELIKFNLKNLTLPKKITIKYYGGSNLNIGSSYLKNHNEIITLIANADNDGIVNEEIIESNFHPAHIISVNKNINNHNYIGAGQSLTNPARASYNLFDEGLDTFRIVYQRYNEKSALTGTYLHSWVNIITLSGITTASFVVTPIVDDLIIGNTSGAIGLVKSINGSSLVVNWQSGKFVVGESVTHNRGTVSSPINQTSNTNISSVSSSLLPSNALTFNFKNGYSSFGLAPELAKSPLTVGGRIAIQRSETRGQHYPEDITNPSLLFIDTYSNTTPSGIEIYLDTLSGLNRLEVKKTNSSVTFGEVGAVKAHTSFSNSALKADTSYNVSSIVRNGTGDYTINFINPFPRADYQISLTNSSDPLDHTIMYVQTDTVLRVRNYQIGTSTLKDLGGLLHVIIVGGDF